jgi:hypothetical protein
VKTPWTPEELELTEEHRRRGGTWNTVLAKVMDEEHHRWYADQLGGHCRRLGISFIDVNDVLSNHPRHTEWSFIDYLHLTNAGYDICAEALTRTLQPLRRSGMTDLPRPEAAAASDLSVEGRDSTPAVVPAAAPAQARDPLAAPASPRGDSTRDRYR